MKKRDLSKQIRHYAKEYPIIGLVGPRQSGKTTLAKALFPKHKYISLESIDLRKQAESDPRGFFADYGNQLILDEVQRTPDLFSYLQELVDENPEPGQYILTGSHQFLLFEAISQSLAGRIATFKLFPFTHTELLGLKTPPPEEIFRKPAKKRKAISNESLYKLLYTGLYPRIHDREINSRKWAENYVLTYIERDVRSLINVQNIRTFETFLQLCASLSGQLINYANLSNHVGVSQPTIKQWISILETSGLIFTLPPYHKNFSKRIIKAPKLYFVDTGILCYLLGIRTHKELAGYPLIGSIFETFIVSECYKQFYHSGEVPRLYFWRDKSGREIDLIIEESLSSFPIEIKAAKTFNNSFQDGIHYWLNQKEARASRGQVIYTGDAIANSTSTCPTVPWYMLT